MNESEEMVFLFCIILHSGEALNKKYFPTKQINREVMGQFVTPQNTAPIPAAVQRFGANPIKFPNRQPKAAPMKKEGTISPPLYPAAKVTVVKSIFNRFPA